MSSTPARLDRLRRAVRRQLLARRRLLAALCTAVAVVAGLRAVTAPPPATVPVLTAAHDLAAGSRLEGDDLRPLAYPPGSVPEGIAADPVGRTLAGPVRAGEPITDVRLVGDRLAAAHPELTTMPVRLPDAGLAGLLEVGARIDLVAIDPQDGASRVVARDVLVLAVPAERSSTIPSGPQGALVVLGVPPAAATAVADASVRLFLSYFFTR